MRQGSGRGARMGPWAGRVLGQVGDPARGRPPAREAYLFDLLRDVGHSEAVEPGHPWTDIGQDRHGTMSWETTAAVQARDDQNLD